MQVVYADKELARCAGDKAYAVRKMGQRRADAYMDRLNDLRGAATLEDLKGVPGRYHELTGNRAGQWACDLDQPYRLIFKSTNKGPAAQIVWANERIAKMLEIVNYHG